MAVYLFNWKLGGYNTVRADSKEEAIQEIKLGKQWRGDSTFYRGCGGIDWASLRLPKPGELEALDAHYAGMFD
jgi:hypothetical protein